jgi:hypothetical protein
VTVTDQPGWHYEDRVVTAMVDLETARNAWRDRAITAEKAHPLLPLLAAMLERKPVRVVVDFTNPVGEVVKPGGWVGYIMEIRRPADDIRAYGHREPVVVVEDGERGVMVLLRPDQVEVVT